MENTSDSTDKEETASENRRPEQSQNSDPNYDRRGEARDIESENANQFTQKFLIQVNTARVWMYMIQWLWNALSAVEKIRVKFALYEIKDSSQIKARIKDRQIKDKLRRCYVCKAIIQKNEKTSKVTYIHQTMMRMKTIIKFHHCNASYWTSETRLSLDSLSVCVTNYF